MFQSCFSGAILAACVLLISEKLKIVVLLYLSTCDKMPSKYSRIGASK